MRTGRHQNQDVFALFGALDVIKIRTSLITIPLSKSLQTSQPEGAPTQRAKPSGVRGLQGEGLLQSFSLTALFQVYQHFNSAACSLEITNTVISEPT